MNCAKTDEVFRLLDGRLSGAERGQAQRHLESCPQCREDVRRWSDLSRRAFSLPERVECPDFSASVMAEIGREQPFCGVIACRLRGFFTVPRLAAAGAAILLIALVAARAAKARRQSEKEAAVFVAEFVSGGKTDDSYTALSERLFGL
ncbi:MAG: zf-HC2 domain-containing protein [Elusimicrobiales bacterium]